MNKQKDNVELKDVSDLGLSELLGQTYQSLMVQSQNLQNIHSEVERREKLVTVSPEAKKVAEKPKEK